MAQSKKADAGAGEVQKAVDEVEDKGYFGVRPDDAAPQEHYTVDGVTSGKPTPESDPELAGTRRAQHHTRSEVS